MNGARAYPDVILRVAQNDIRKAGERPPNATAVGGLSPAASLRPGASARLSARWHRHFALRHLPDQLLRRALDSRALEEIGIHPTPEFDRPREDEIAEVVARNQSVINQLVRLD